MIKLKSELTNNTDTSDRLKLDVPNINISLVSKKKIG